jgi:L-ribulose-5-phosphate 3-epimerase
MIQNIGFMQGRLSPVIDGKIQSFPWKTWQSEIKIAKNIGFNIMEWTLDQHNLYENPLMTYNGQKEIRKLCKKYDFSIPSLTGDCFMQAPFWKVTDKVENRKLKQDFLAILSACNEVGITTIVVPLVDNGSLNNLEQENCLVDFLLEQEAKISGLGIKIIFESDFTPLNLSRFISRLNVKNFGINYDIGNSASFGFDPVEEFQVIGNRILNIHVKDRFLNGSTVALGIGDAQFSLVFKLLQSQNYSLNYILQTARADNNDDHSEVLSIYKKFVINCLEYNES